MSKESDRLLTASMKDAEWAVKCRKEMLDSWHRGKEQGKLEKDAEYEKLRIGEEVAYQQGRIKSRITPPNLLRFETTRGRWQALKSRELKEVRGED